MKRLIFIFASLLFWLISNGQIVNVVDASTGPYDFLETDGSVRGTKYFFNSWGVGKITFNKGKTSNSRLLQIDLELNHLLVKDDRDDAKGLVMDIREIEKFTITETSDNGKNSTYTFLKIEPDHFEKPAKEPKYYKQISNDSEHIIKEITKEIFDHAQSNTNNFDKKSYKEYKTRNTYYIKNSGGKYEKINNLNTKAFTKVFPHIKKEIHGFVKAKNIDFDNPVHLDSLIAFCLTLE